MFCDGYQVFWKYFRCFRCMLQVFHIDVAKVDLVLHMLQQDPSAAAACSSRWGVVHGRGKRRGMEAGARGPRRMMQRGWRQGRACMRVYEAEGAQASGRMFLHARGHM
jgi:hypothetical protein